MVEKGITERQYGLSRWDVIVGCFVTDIVAFFIVVACGATLYVNGRHDITDAADAAVALKPLVGQFASWLFAAGLVNAAFLSAAIFPLATTYNICEGLGVESGINKRFSEAPECYWLYTAHRFWCRRGADSAHSAHSVDSGVAGRQRCPAAVRAVLHAQAGESRRRDGTLQEEVIPDIPL